MDKLTVDKLTEDQVADALHRYPDWSETGGAIQRTYQFKDFAASMKFVNQVAAAAESAQHHPDILVRWNKVTLTLSTHDAGGISQKDFDLAGQCDSFAPPPPPPAPKPAPPKPAAKPHSPVPAAASPSSHSKPPAAPHKPPSPPPPPTPGPATGPGAGGAGGAGGAKKGKKG